MTRIYAPARRAGLDAAAILEIRKAVARGETVEVWTTGPDQARRWRYVQEELEIRILVPGGEYVDGKVQERPPREPTPDEIALARNEELEQGGDRALARRVEVAALRTAFNLEMLAADTDDDRRKAIARLRDLARDLEIDVLREILEIRREETECRDALPGGEEDIR